MENLTEQDLESIFSGKKIKRISPVFSIIYTVIIIILIGIGIFAILNFNALKNIFTYKYQNEFTADDQSPGAMVTIPTLATENNASKVQVSKINNNILRIDTLNLEAPISWRVANTPDTVANALENGLIQIDGTALPGEKGNIFITGHSSNYAWAKGKYNSIFAILNNLVIGDIIHLKYQDRLFVYQVSEKKIVSATDLSVMAPTQKPILTLATCWPVGTAYKRLIIIADQISPDPKTDINQKNIIKNSSLPKTH